jgi:hypothetical protein
MKGSDKVGLMRGGVMRAEWCEGKVWEGDVVEGGGGVYQTKKQSAHCVDKWSMYYSTKHNSIPCWTEELLRI